MDAVVRPKSSLMGLGEHRMDYGSVLDRAAEPAAHAATPKPANNIGATIVRHRWWLFGTVIVFFLLSFNGQWRIGRDGALYRGLGHSLATGQGYTFGDFGRHQIYPGLPLVLAALEKVFGRADWPPLVLMQLAGLTCLLITYKLIGLRFPLWVAVTVTFLVGMNGWFLELSNEILTDIPFLLGLLLALYGWEHLRANGSAGEPVRGFDPPFHVAGGRWWVSLTILLVGITLAALMRPTFWILAAAWVTVCAWGLIAGPRRRFYAICLGVLLAVWLCAMLVDPRVKGINPLGGGYERDALNAIERISQRVRVQLPSMLRTEFPQAFFGQSMLPVMAQALTVIVLGSSLLLLRVNPLWTLLILLTAATTVVMTSVPRYYTMVLPLMLASWVMLLVWLENRLGPRWGPWALVLGLALVMVPSVARSVKVIGEQRFGEESWANVRAMAEQVRLHVPPGAKVLGPGPTIMSYFSGHRVLMAREIFSESMDPKKYPAQLAKAGVSYAVFPPTLYRKGERVLRDLMERGVIRPVRRIARVGDMVLAKVEIHQPEGDWRKGPKVPVLTPRGVRTVASSTQPAVVVPRKAPTTASVRRAAKLQKQLKQDKLDRQERQARKLRHQKAERKRLKEQAPATQPVTAPLSFDASARRPPLPLRRPLPSRSISRLC